MSRADDMYRYWMDAWQALGVAPPVAAFDDLCSRYSEGHRHYHTLQHLRECFSRFDLVREQCDSPASVLLALWFHDAIYDTRAQDNEAASATLADVALAGAGVPELVRRRVGDLILATSHTSAAVTGDAALLLDVDLAILGAPAARFAEYEGQIRREYAWVADDAFRRGRRAVLQHFLDRTQIFHTCAFMDLESQARVNLAASLRALAAV